MNHTKSERGIAKRLDAIRSREWQIMMVGPDLSAIDAQSRKIFETLLERRPDLSGFSVETVRGGLRVTRDPLGGRRLNKTDASPLASDAEVDAMLAELFSCNSDLLAVVLADRRVTPLSAERPRAT